MLWGTDESEPPIFPHSHPLKNPGGLARICLPVPKSIFLLGCATSRVMERLNLTLSEDTYQELKRHAERVGKPCARLAREILSEGLLQRAAQEQRERLAQDYAAGRADAHEVLEDWEGAQAELLTVG